MMDDEIQNEIIYEYDYNSQQFFEKIKTEYNKGLIRVYIWTFLIISIYLSHQFFIGLYEEPYLRINLLKIFVLAIFIIYMGFQFFYLTYSRFSPTLKKFLEEEVSSLGFRLNKAYQIYPYYIFFLISSV
ncbi:MAG: hypothetical protein EU549_01030, partial [Promethearchaeota archaeon]